MKRSFTLTLFLLLTTGLVAILARPQPAEAEPAPPAVLANPAGAPITGEDSTELHRGQENLILPGPAIQTGNTPANTPLAADVCERTIVANVVALDQPYFYNRLGAYNPAGMIFALRRDVINKNTGKTEAEGGALRPGEVALRSDKRPRPLTLRMNIGDCLQINFQNLLAPNRVDNEQPVTRDVSIHVNGLQPVHSILDDGSFVGKNPSSLVEPGGTATYTLYGEHENTYLLYNMAVTAGSEGNGGTMAFGLYGAVNVEPRGSEWYRSQVTRSEMELATKTTATGSGLIPQKTAGGHPIIDYTAVYPPGHRFAGLPILNMLDGNEIVHSDLNAIITVPGGTYPSNPSYPKRDEPFREFTVIFADEVFALQAFDIFEDPDFAFTLHSVRDGFAINYGTGGIGAEIVANRMGLGPMWNCTGCKYEEFFLTSWAVGDPAMLVDIPANADLDGDGRPDPGSKATKALYPDDPANVYHSYLNDHLKFRNLHAGAKEHHIFHLHAHQWLNTPDDPNSTYLDSQAIGPGSAYTYEIAHGGSGNRNKTPGDSIFHCHFYPHFAQGMWSLWRVHDTFEEGTEMEVDPVDGRYWPKTSARALPDGEIVRGTPIPAVVPIPGLAMAPMPGAAHIAAQDANNDGVADSSQVVVTEPDTNGDGMPDKNPGYPFFVPGKAGHRPPTPPLDILDDGGLPRHVLLNGDASHVESPVDFSKDVESVEAEFLPEEGTAEEKAAMAFHAAAAHPSYSPDGNPANFETNGLGPVAGAPYADPCRSDSGGPINSTYGTNNPRIYKAANIQLDVILNKVGWHVPQQRFLTLWEDVLPTLNRERPPQPLVMRLNSRDCAEYWHTNLVPGYYELDDFQVRTPTDVIGQHIHLVKFDVTSADGSSNGFNYEDGTLSPDEVRERIRAIRRYNACTGDEINGGDSRDGSEACPVAQPHPFFGSGPDNKWVGARTTIQRWYADPILNTQGWDRGLGTIFTHDHYAPSTHQQVGLYATVLAEPEGSAWRHPESGETFGSRHDGGPTNWSADILTSDPTHSHREFFFEFADFQLAYEEGYGLDSGGKAIPDFEGAINPPFRVDGGTPEIFFFPNICENGMPRPCAEAISADDPGTFSVNYRNEPLGLRILDPQTNSQASGRAGDLSYVFSSKIERAIPALNSQPNWYPPLTRGIEPGDPYTPLLRVYQGDKVRIRVQVGATEEQHNINFHGLKWRQEFASENSGWRNSQMMGLSEQFHLDMPMVPGPDPDGDIADYLYTMGAQVDDYWNGIWGLMRAYRLLRDDLLPLPNNPMKRERIKVINEGRFDEICPVNAPVRRFDITAVTARDVLPGGTLVYNSRTGSGSYRGPLHDPTALMYVFTDDLDPETGLLKPNVPIEPLIIRANAGDCLKVTLRNNVPDPAPDMAGFNALPPIIKKDKINGGFVTFNANNIKPSSHVGLHPQLLAYDVTRSDGANVGLNEFQTVDPGPANIKEYTWYAGEVTIKRIKPSGNVRLDAWPIEFGAVNLMPSDKIKQSNKGLVGALIIEPLGATWREDEGTRASATVTKPDGSTFREFVVIFQNDINLRYGDDEAVPGASDEPESEDSGQKAINYRTEPLWFRVGIGPETPFEDVGDITFDDVYANLKAGGEDPQTPLFTAEPGSPVRFRYLQPGGHARGHVFTIHGHVWPRSPHTDGSNKIGYNPLTQWFSAQEGLSAGSHFDFVLDSAGGKFAVPGDYLYRDAASFGNYGGLWGIMRVEAAPEPEPADPLYLSLAKNGAIGNLTGVRDEDIISFDGREFAMFFDGSDVGVGGVDVDAFYILNSDTLLMSFDRPTAIAGVGWVDDSDIVRFDADSLGSDTAGVFSRYFDGSDVGLTRNSEDIDALTLLPDGTLVVSTVGWVRVPGLVGRDEDLLAFTPETLGSDTAGSWDMYFDGSKVKLANTRGEDVSGVVVGDNGNIYLTTVGTFNVPGLSGTGDNVFVCESPSTGSATSCTFATAFYFEGSLWGVSNNSLDGIDLGLMAAAPDTGANQPPVAVDDAATTPQDTPVSITVTANDTDDSALDLTTVTLTGSGPVSGTAIANLDGTITYTPTTAFTGVDSLAYTVNDDAGATSNVATVTITVTATLLNQPPVAVNDAATTPQDTPVSITVTANDTDDSALDLTTVTLTGSGPVSGTAIANLDGTITYTPTTAFTGVDSLAYTVNDDAGATSNVATVTITVTTASTANNPPQAGDDTAATNQDTPVTITVLDNDTDIDGNETINPATVAITGSGPVSGTAAANLDGTITYTPTTGFTGVDSFTYTVNDNDGATSNEATVTVTVSAPPVTNNPPQAGDDTAATNQDTPVTITVLDNDTDIDGNETINPATVAITGSGPASGTAAANLDGTITYTPTTAFTGVDSFTYTVNDNDGATSNEATVTVTVSAPPVTNNPPVAAAINAVTDEDTAVVIDILANVSDPDGDTLLLVVDTAGANGGQIVDNSNGTFTYTPPPGFNGDDTFTYTVDDGNGGLVSATVTVTVNPVNDPPLAGDAALSTDQDTPVTIDEPALLSNTSDPDGDTLTLAVDAASANGGQIVDNSNGTFTYTPPPGFNGDDTFTYTVDDGNGGSASATVTVTVAGASAPPPATIDTITVTRAVFRINNNRWNIRGTGSVTGNTVTIYLGPVDGGQVIAADVAVDAAGAWQYRRQSTVVPQPKGDIISVVSSGGGVVEAYPVKVR